MNKIFKLSKRMFPRISRTEQIALESGTPGFEKHAFDGTMTQRLLTKYKPSSLSQNDRDMIAKIPALVSTVDEHEIIRRRVTPKDHPFWKKAKDNNFFGLIVPDKYGGKQLTSTGLSSVLQRLSSVSASVPVHVMVPASLGPAELLTHYGTDRQREYFLPKLAAGAIPCFGLTSLHAGSDAAGSMTDTGTSFIRSDGSVGIRLQCDKRYITLAPVADIVGIAFKLQDPEGLLESLCGRKVDGEITLALLEKGILNLELGTYTDPLGVGFANGTVRANGVEINIDDVIGGANGLGEGWKFLMEALAAGRGIALPAGAAGSSKMLCNAVGGYCGIRKQFKTPIGKFEGIQEKLADMAIKTFEIDSMVSLMNCMLDAGERPPIMSAILKQRSTELGRDVVMHSMDIVAGSAICMGSQNFVAPAYLSSPIGITVEGSNTMTRSLLIFGQGLVRSHPRLLNIIHSIQSDNVDQFTHEVKHLVLENVKLAISPTFRLSRLDRFVHFFALSSNASLLLGGELKRREFISGRYADMLSYLVAGYSMQWHAENAKITESAICNAVQVRNLNRLMRCAEDLIENHPHSILHKMIYFRTVGSAQFKDVPDNVLSKIALEMQTNKSELRNLFDANVVSNLHCNIARINKALTNPEAMESLHDEIMRVDTFECSENGILVPTI